jgi:hypothetical protein
MRILVAAALVLGALTATTAALADALSYVAW